MSDTLRRRFQIGVAACLLVTALPHPLFAGANSLTPDEVRELARQSERARLDADSALIGVKQIRQELINRLLLTQEMLQSLEQKATDHFGRMTALLKNDQGRLLAQDPNSLGFATYLRLKEEPVVTLNEINERQLLLSSLLRRVLVGQDGPEVGYLPDQETRDQVSRLYFWVADRQEPFDGQMSALDRLLRSKPAEGWDPSQGMTLSDKLDERRAYWEQLLAKLRQMAGDEVRPEVREIMLEVYKYVALEKGKLEADILKTREDLSMVRQRQDHELAMQDQTFQLERARQLADEDLKRRQDNLDNQLRELKALRDLDKALADMKLNKLETTTARQQLIARAESADVQLLLRPFIAKGYWQPNRANRGYERSGMSLQLIKRQNCLVPGVKGLQSLLTLGTNPANRERGPWTFPRRLQRLTSEQQDQLRQAQEYLIDLGQTLIDLDYLAE